MNALRNFKSAIGQSVAVSTLVVVGAISGVPGSADAAELEWTIAPYIWGTDVGMDLVVNDEPGLGVEVPFSDVVDKLEMAFMGHAEVRGERFGGFFDMFYADLGDTQTIPLGEPINDDVVVDAGLKMQIYELGGLYRMGRPDPGKVEVDFLLGGRRLEIDQEFNFTLPGKGGGDESASINVSETDVFAGVRLIGKFNERWGYAARADYGWGGTDGTLNALAAIGYTFGQTGLFTLDLGYRYMTIDLSSSPGDNVTIETEITLSGPVVGLIFNF